MISNAQSRHRVAQLVSVGQSSDCDTVQRRQGTPTLARAQDDGQHAILETVVVENICKRGRDYATNSQPLMDHGACSRATRSQSCLLQQELSFTILWLVEHEIRFQYCNFTSFAATSTGFS